MSHMNFHFIIIQAELGSDYSNRSSAGDQDFS